MYVSKDYSSARQKGAVELRMKLIELKPVQVRQ